MTYPLPIRTTAASAQDHVDDHNTIHSLLGCSLPTGITIGATGHLAHHTRIHNILNTIQSQTLPSPITNGLTNHVPNHNTIHSLMNTETYGPRGPVGQQPSGDISGYPTSWTVDNITTQSALQTAVNAAGTGRRFHLTGSWTFTGATSIQPHANDEFWGEDGVTITKGGTVHDAIKPASGVTGVKVMNLKFVGFTDTTQGSSPSAVTSGAGSSNWEIGYCEFTGNTISTSLA